MQDPFNTRRLPNFRTERFFKSVFDDAGSASALLDQIKQSAKEAHSIADRVEHKGLQLKSTFIQRQCFDRNQT